MVSYVFDYIHACNKVAYLEELVSQHQISDGLYSLMLLSLEVDLHHEVVDVLDQNLVGVVDIPKATETGL